jgi:small subunit ribosomal protein S9
MTPKTKTIKEATYFEARGARKTSVARVRLFENKKGITVNDKDYREYFPLMRLQETVLSPLRAASSEDSLGVSVKVAGGGLAAQAEAVRLGISRALLQIKADLKPRFRAMGFLTRDSRMVERKKYGLKKARRAPQWAKR